MKGHEIYQQLLNESQRIGLPDGFKEDLTKHDRQVLENPDGPDVFGWVLRQLGTHLLDPRMTYDSINGFIEHFRVNGRDNLYYWFDGTLREVSFEQFCKLMWDTHNSLGGHSPDYNNRNSCWYQS